MIKKNTGPILMKKKEKQFVVRSKIWIEDMHGKVAFGLGRFRMLEAIDRFGSMQAAARQLKMSYRSIWCRIRESEERIGREIVVRHGKGSSLTPFARELMQRFVELKESVSSAADERFDHLLAGSLRDS